MKKLKSAEEDITQSINDKFINDDYGIPIHLNKNEIIFEATIDKIEI